MICKTFKPKTGVNQNGITTLVFIYSAYALFAAGFIAKLKTKTANRVVGTVYLGAAGALASIQK